MKFTPKPRKCAICKDSFLPLSMSHKVCGKKDCIHAFILLSAAKSAARAKRAERKEIKERKEAIKTRSDWLKDAQKAFNAFIRERDKDKPCICCGVAETQVSGLGSHGWDCGHYRSVGSAPHLRFDERNAHRQLVKCNRYGAGRAVDYRIGLINRIGVEQVEALEAENCAAKWTIEDLKQITAVYRAKLKALKEAK